MNLGNLRSLFLCPGNLDLDFGGPEFGFLVFRVLVFGFLFFGVTSFRFRPCLMRTFQIFSETHLGITKKNVLKIGKRSLHMSQSSNLRSKTISGKWKPFKNNEKCFFKTIKALSVRNIFGFLSWLFWSCRKTAW